MIDRPEGLTTDEWKMIKDHRKKQERDRYRNLGLADAAGLADNWAEQCCGGSGEGGEGYRNLANAIRGMMS
jgi:hypothetical protein